jgi:hypothetical protein
MHAPAEDQFLLYSSRSKAEQASKEHLTAREVRTHSTTGAVANSGWFNSSAYWGA